MEQNLVQGNKYLIKRSDTVSMIEVLVITETSYKFKYESGVSDWTTREHFHSWYTIIEDVTNYGIGEIPSKESTKTMVNFETCSICHGKGTIPDNISTAKTKPCPLCMGNKIVPKYT